MTPWKHGCRTAEAARHHQRAGGGFFSLRRFKDIHPYFQATYLILFFSTFGQMVRGQITNSMLPLYSQQQLGYSATTTGLLFSVMLSRLPRPTSVPHTERDAKRRESLRREISVSMRLQHENIIRLLDVVVSGDRIHLVMEIARGGEHHLHGPAGTCALFNVAVLHTPTTRPTMAERRTVQIYYGHHDRAPLANDSSIPAAFWRDGEDVETRGFYGVLNERTKKYMAAFPGE